MGSQLRAHPAVIQQELSAVLGVGGRHQALLLPGGRLPQRQHLHVSGHQLRCPVCHCIAPATKAG